MKVPIPLNSSLSTDSHPSDIKNPAVSKDLFKNNNSYYYNGNLTNPKKRVINQDGYITTRGNILTAEQFGEKIIIKNGNVVIADVLALGIEDVSFYDRDDAVIHDGYLWTVLKTLSGFIVEKINLKTHEIESFANGSGNETHVRFIRNTCKIITLNKFRIITIYDNVESVGHEIPDYFEQNNVEIPVIAEYFTNFNGEFTAVEINGKITFGFNNPVGVPKSKPVISIDVYITSNINDWRLLDVFSKNALSQNESYIFNIQVSNNVKIGCSTSGNFAMDFFTGIERPELHKINLLLGNGVVISGRGGRGGNVQNAAVTAGQNGTVAINSCIDLDIRTISGTATIQGGAGGGGASYNYYSSPTGSFYLRASGGGGAGIENGLGGIATGSGNSENLTGYAGTETTGGNGKYYQYGSSSARVSSGKGGDPGKNGTAGSYGVSSAGGIGADAIRITANALLSISESVILKGNSLSGISVI